MAYNPYFYTGYDTYPGNPGGSMYQPPAMDNLAQLRQNQMAQAQMGQPMGQPAMRGQMMNPGQQPVGQMSAVPPTYGLIWVQGEEGAKSYQVAPGNSVQLMDSENPVFYIKSVDASGIPLPLRVFDFVERTPGNSALPQTPIAAQPAMPDLSRYVTQEELESTRKELSALAAKLESISENKQTGYKPIAKTPRGKKEDADNGESAL